MKSNATVVEPIIFTEFNETAEVKTPTASVKNSPFDVLIDRSKHLLGEIRQWYHRPSEAYSTLIGQEISPRSMVRVNLLTVAVIVLGLCASESLLVTGVTSACVGWIAYQSKGGRR